VITIKLYGAERCHKTKYYKAFLEERKVEYQFLDVEESKESAEELRNLYETRNRHFPTITIGEKRLRNPSEKELIKWLGKLI